jgi:hypothetical protein
VVATGRHQLVEELLASRAAVEQRQLPAGDERRRVVLAGDDVRRRRQLLDDVPEVDELVNRGAI